ncbi:MAG TPA: hypothetical protein PK586_00815 [Casimicrobium sp.]|nr:hypothetical protein [Casimicrobium sp.]
MTSSDTFQRVQQHGTDLGVFWNNFNNLEMFLRLFLARKSGLGTEAILRCMSASQGECLDENPITDWRTFGALCNAYNAAVGSTNEMDFSELVRLRDALAHGRVSGDSQGRLIVTKYSKPIDSKVRVEVHQMLDSAFLQRLSEMSHQMCVEISNSMQPYMRP